MATEWRTIPLGELYEFSSGLSKPRAAFGAGYPFLSFKDVFYRYFVPERLSELVRSTERERVRCSIRRGDVFLTRTSETTDELGMSCVALRDVPDGTFNGFTKRLRPRDDGNVLPEYAGYYFRGPRFRREVDAMSTLSTRASLNNAMLARLTIDLPPMTEQMAIARVLGTLDDKIDLNRRTNETLEAMARALFKSWFVDFDPVRAKAEGRDPGLPKPIADLFPQHFEPSQLGDIPAGWGQATLATFTCKRRERVGSRHAAVLSALAEGKLVRSEDYFTKRVYSKSIDKYLLVEHGDLAYNPSRINIGSIGLHEGAFAGAVSPVYVVVRPDPDFRWFLWFFLRLGSTKNWINTLASGSVRQSLSYVDFASIPSVVPPRPILKEFEARWTILRDGIRAREAESRTLADIRDALRPELLSGRIRMTGAEGMEGA
jgi:type I restriction enzyme, S subunit